MPGLKIVVGTPDASPPSESAPETLAPEIHRHRESVFSAPGIDVSFDVPEDYPSFRFADDEFFLFVEGLVYNRSDEELVQLGSRLAACVRAGEPVDATVLEFLRHADGEFALLLVHKPSATVVVCNERWGRLSLYAAQTPSQLVIAREPVDILPHLPAIRIDRRTLVEWLAFEYTLNDRWFVEGVDRLPPATLCMAVVGPALRVERRTLEVRDLTVTEPIRDWQAAARRFAEVFLGSFTARARKLTECGYRLTADLSGGLDSRMIFAAARRLELPVEFYTDHLVSGDESEVAQRLAESCGGRVTRVARPEFVRDAAEWRRWTYLTSGRVSAPTTMGALLVTQARRTLAPGRAARFMGLFGELIRRPPLPARGYGGFAGALAADAYTRYVGFRDGCGLLGLDWADYRRHLEATVDAWPERGLAARCRRLDMFMGIGVGNAGEDRHRWHFWTLSPVWANPVIDFAYRHISPGMNNLAFFTEMLRAVYPPVLAAPLHHSPVRLASPAGVRYRTLEREVLTRVRQHRLVRWLRRVLRDPERWAKPPGPGEREWIQEQTAALFRESAAVRANFDEPAVTRYLATQRARVRLHHLLTALWFVAEVDRRFPGRAGAGAR